MYAAGICPKLTIRFPNAAPFECWISLIHRASEPPGLSCVPLVNVSTCQHAHSRKRLSPCHLAHMSPRDLWSRRGSEIQRYVLTPCSAQRCCFE